MARVIVLTTILVAIFSEFSNGQAPLILLEHHRRGRDVLMDSSQIEQIAVGHSNYSFLKLTQEGFLITTRISVDTLRISVDSVVTRIWSMMKDTTFLVPFDKVTAIYGYKLTNSKRLSREPREKLFIPIAIVTTALLTGAAFLYFEDDLYSAIGTSLLVAVPMGLFVGLGWKTRDDPEYFDTRRKYRLVIVPKKFPLTK